MSSPLPVDLDLAARLRSRRHALHLSQVVAAVRGGVSLASVQRAEAYGAATTRTLGALAKVYGCSVDQLRGRPCTEIGGAS